MWSPIINAEQIQQGTRLRKQILGVNGQVEAMTEYMVTECGEHYFLLQAIRTHVAEIAPGHGDYFPIYKGKIVLLQNQGVEIWVNP
jgi:hypothetical protein